MEKRVLTTLCAVASTAFLYGSPAPLRASIRDALRRFVFPGHDVREVIASGGGTRNACLVSLLREMLAPLRVSLIEDYGIPSRAKEALSFAVLANETLSGNPSNVPSATGARAPAVLGSITPAG